MGTCGGRGGGGEMWLGAWRRMDTSDVCAVLGVDRSTERSIALSALFSRASGVQRRRASIVRWGGRW